MKVVVAPDSFKESLSAKRVAQAIGRGIHMACPNAQVIELPMADGGEGTLEALLQGTQGEKRYAEVTDALGRPCTAAWGWIAPDTAFIEMASAAGLEQVAPQDRDVMQADTRGVGHLVLQALNAGVKRVVLTAGGSATNDGGAGLLHALGMRFLDASGQTLRPVPTDLLKLAELDASDLDPRIPKVDWIIATDVENPLCGERGASAIFGPQKGATAEQIRSLDAMLARFAHLSNQARGQVQGQVQDLGKTPGAGAGGGIGFAAIAWLNAKVRAGAELVAELAGLDAHIATADLVITGEGRMDQQTLYGKAPMQVIRTARRHHVPVIGIAGSLGSGYEALYEHGLVAAFSLTSGPMTLQQACERAPELLEARARDIMRTMILGVRA